MSAKDWGENDQHEASLGRPWDEDRPVVRGLVSTAYSMGIPSGELGTPAGGETRKENPSLSGHLWNCIVTRPNR